MEEGVFQDERGGLRRCAGANEYGDFLSGRHKGVHRRVQSRQPRQRTSETRRLDVITSAAEFVRLRNSTVQEEYSRAARDEASEETWFDVIRTAPEMRRWVAYNKTVPLAVLRVLAEDPDSDVRWVVAQKRKADPALLEQLAGDPDETVRHRVACNRSTPRWLIERLASDESEMVAETARERLAEPDRA